jgi:hypothetical protein
MQAWWARRERDKEADWKVPIRFYGRVVDQDRQPVSGATVHFQWTVLSKQGTSEADTVSDEGGNFSLTGARGKNLGVYVTKQGYYTPENIKASGFEFADPAEPNFYEPDPKILSYFLCVRRAKERNWLRRQLKWRYQAMARGLILI